MATENTYSVEICIPFPSCRLAEITYDVLRVDAEPPRSTVTKELSYNKEILKAKFSSTQLKQLRVSVNGFYENINLIIQTMNFAGPPVSDNYVHYNG